MLSVQSQQPSLLRFKSAVGLIPPTIVVRQAFRDKTMLIPSAPAPPPQRVASTSQTPPAADSPTSLKRKSPSRAASAQPDKPSSRRANSSKSSVKSKRSSSSRADSVPSNASKQSRLPRSKSRRESEELLDFNYTPPPKRARSQQEFGSMEGPIQRKCFTELDGDVGQYSAFDVVKKLLPTYKAYFLDSDGKSSTEWQIDDAGNFPQDILEYPNDSAHEVYPLIVPKDPQHYNPLMELMESLEVIIKNYVPPPLQCLFGTPSQSSLAVTLNQRSSASADVRSDLLQSLRIAEHRNDGPAFKATLFEINQLLRDIKSGKLSAGLFSTSLSPTDPHNHADVPSPLTDISFESSPETISSPESSGPEMQKDPPTMSSQSETSEDHPTILNPLRRVVKTWNGVPSEVWKTILSEAYQRCVGPSVPLLKEYLPHSSETYGELEASLISDIVHYCGIGAETKFMDLGSGVGNVALQLSLQAGCTTYGVEIRPLLHELAMKQRSELEKRCRMWGVTTNFVELEQADFRNSERTRDMLKKADVVLANNFKFGPELNATLANMFLDMKEGAIVVTLNPLLPENFRISIHTMSNPLAIFVQEEREYPRGSVSWSHVSGKYFVNRVDRNPLHKFAEENQEKIKEVSRRSKYTPAPQKRGRRQD